MLSPASQAEYLWIAPLTKRATQQDGDALLITKGTKWSYEREWRMLVPLRHAKRSVPIASDTVHLFTFPPDALLGVILGVNATHDTQAEVKNLLTTPELQHIQMTRAVLDLDSRSVKVSFADGKAR